MKKLILLLCISMPVFSCEKPKTKTELEASVAYSIVELNAMISNLETTRNRLIRNLEMMRDTPLEKE